MRLFFLIFSISLMSIQCSQPINGNNFMRQVIELNLNESKEITLPSGEKVCIKLLDIKNFRDDLRGAVRKSLVKIEVDGKETLLSSGNYNLPQTIGKIKIDCPITKGYYQDSRKDEWVLRKDARFRIWSKDAPLFRAGSFVYPVKQKWFAGMTQSGNEPTFVNFGEKIFKKKVYYHSGHDIGGVEGIDEIVSATDGIIISAAGKNLKNYADFPADTRPDVVYIEDQRGWCIRYSHLDSIFENIKPGTKIKAGEKIGLMGKKSTSGGWVHLHFEIKYKEKLTNKWATEDAYAYLWQAYLHTYKSPLFAIARPHHIVNLNDEVILDGRKSMSPKSKNLNYQWILSNYEIVDSSVAKIKYATPGEYSEILKVTDAEGNTDYDFCLVQVYDKTDIQMKIPTMQAAYYPTLDIEVGDTIKFYVRTFNAHSGNEIWDFGDGTSSVTTQSTIPENFSEGKFAQTSHIYKQAGHYIVSVQRTNENGHTAKVHLHVEIN